MSPVSGSYIFNESTRFIPFALSNNRAERVSFEWENDGKEKRFRKYCNKSMANAINNARPAQQNRTAYTRAYCGGRVYTQNCHCHCMEIYGEAANASVYYSVWRKCGSHHPAPFPFCPVLIWYHFGLQNIRAHNNKKKMCKHKHLPRHTILLSAVGWKMSIKISIIWEWTRFDVWFWEFRFHYIAKFVLCGIKKFFRLLKSLPQVGTNNSLFLSKQSKPQLFFTIRYASADVPKMDLMILRMKRIPIFN